MSLTIAHLSNTQAVHSQLLYAATATVTNPIMRIQASAAAEAAYSQALENYYDNINIYGMTPDFGGNLAMAVIMGIFWVAQTTLMIWYKQWWFGIAFWIGCGLEFAGYIGRTLSSKDVSNIDDFLLQIITLTLAPAFITAGIYFMLAKLTVVYGEKYSKLRPMTYSKIFIVCDLTSIVIQAAGGGLAATALADGRDSTPGTHVMVAGIAFQVFSITLFLYFVLDFFIHLRHGFVKGGKNDVIFEEEYADLRKTRLFKYFPISILAATIFIYIRSIYRVAELAEGWRGHLILTEDYFFILDALMMGLAIFILTLHHPGFVFRHRDIPLKTKSAFKGKGDADKITDEEANPGLKDYDTYNGKFHSRTPSSDDLTDHNVIINAEEEKTDH